MASIQQGFGLVSDQHIQSSLDCGFQVAGRLRMVAVRSTKAFLHDFLNQPKIAQAFGGNTQGLGSIRCPFSASATKWTRILQGKLQSKWHFPS